MSRVVFVNRYFYPDHSATSQLLSDLAFYLAGQGKRITVITSRQLYSNSEERLSAKETIDDVEIVRVWTTHFGRSNLFGRAFDYLSFYISAFWALLRLLRKGDTVIAKTDPPLISIVASLAASIRSARLINWTQDLFPEVGTELGVKVLDYVKPALLWLRNKSLNHACINVVIGQTMRDKLLSLSVSNDKIRIIPNWSDGDLVRPVGANENALKHEWGLEKCFVIGYSGNMGRAHEFETILKIADTLQSHADVKFLFIGEGAKRKWLEEEVSRRTLKNILFKPYQDRDLLSYSLSLPDIHVISLLPNLEGLIVPSKYYGVAAVGRPCLFIGDSNGEISRILRSYQCGQTIDIGDYQKGVDYILKLKDEDELRKQQGEAARKAFNENYDSRIAFGKWMAILDNL